MSGTLRLLGAVYVTARFRAPTGDGELLAVPPLSEIGAQCDANARLFNSSQTLLGRTPLAEIRQAAIPEVLAASHAYLLESNVVPPTFQSRLLLAGHQPELFHPGVWVKNFALSRVALQHGLAPLNLVVDNDTVKGTAIRIPIVAEQPEDVRFDSLSFDDLHAELPYEEHHRANLELFDSFLTRVKSLTRNWGFNPVVFEAWPKFQAEHDQGVPLWEAVSRLRHGLEQRWGVNNFELPVSRLADTQAFAEFVGAIVEDLPRFVDSYNAAIQAYRFAHRLRSLNHPAPELERKGEWIESPFWIWRTDLPKRERLFARRIEGGIEYQAGERSLGRQTPATLKSAGWKVRPRALALTLFVRLCLADGFIHGIGGGKYDEVTDTIIELFFRIEPPAYAVVSATLRLPLPRFPATTDEQHLWHRRVRDWEWNPQREAEVQARQSQLVARKQELIAREPTPKTDRRQWFRDLQHVTREMRISLEARIQEGHVKEQRIESQLAANAILGSREFAWLLFPEGELRELFAAVHGTGLS